MSVVLVFVLVLIGFASWWLLQQRVTSKPWLEVGPDPIGGPDDLGLPTPKIALGVFLAVVGALFALFASAYFMRMEFADWRAMPVPRIVWLNTGLLVLASVLLHCALAAERQGDVRTTQLSLLAGGAATLGFLAGQLAAWSELSASGFLVAGNPADSFFYLLTGVHGLHILGGLVALGRTLPAAWRAAPISSPPHRMSRTGAAIPPDLSVDKSGRACPPEAGAFPREPGRRGPIASDGPGGSPLAFRHGLQATDRARPHRGLALSVRRQDGSAVATNVPEIADQLRLRLELCATYWDFLLLVWLGLLVLFTGWATDIVAICRQILT